MTKRTIQLVVLCLSFSLQLISWSGSGFAQKQNVADKQALLALKVLGYDQDLKERAKRSGNKVAILVVYKEGDAGSRASAQAVKSAFDSLSKTLTVQNLEFSASVYGFGGEAALSRELEKSYPTSIFAVIGLESEVSTISRVTRDRKTLSISGEESSVRSGLSVGVLPQAAQSKLLVNLPAARAEGVRFSPALLSYAQVIKE